MTTKSRLHNGLCRNIGAQAHVRKHVETQDIIACTIFIAAQDHPANAEACNHVRLGQATEGDAEQIRCQRSNRYVLFAIHNKAIINFVRENDQLVLARNLNNFFQKLTRIERTRWIVGVDNDNCLGAVGNLFLDVINIGVPFRLFVTHVVNNVAACKRCACGPQWIVRGRNQNFITVV